METHNFFLFRILVHLQFLLKERAKEREGARANQYVVIDTATYDICLVKPLCTRPCTYGSVKKGKVPKTTITRLKGHKQLK